MSKFSIQKADPIVNNHGAAIAYIEQTIRRSPKNADIVDLVFKMINMSLGCLYEFVDTDGDISVCPCVSVNFLAGGGWALSSPWLREDEAEYPFAVADNGDVVCPSLGADLVGVEAIVDAFVAKHQADVVAAINKINESAVDRFTAHLYKHSAE